MATTAAPMFFKEDFTVNLGAAVLVMGATLAVVGLVERAALSPVKEGTATAAEEVTVAIAIL